MAVEVHATHPIPSWCQRLQETILPIFVLTTRPDVGHNHEQAVVSDYFATTLRFALNGVEPDFAKALYLESLELLKLIEAADETSQLRSLLKNWAVATNTFCFSVTELNDCAGLILHNSIVAQVHMLQNTVQFNIAAAADELLANLKASCYQIITARELENFRLRYLSKLLPEFIAVYNKFLLPYAEFQILGLDYNDDASANDILHKWDSIVQLSTAWMSLKTGSESALVSCKSLQVSRYLYFLLQNIGAYFIELRTALLLHLWVRAGIHYFRSLSTSSGSIQERQDLIRYVSNIYRTIRTIFADKPIAAALWRRWCREKQTRETEQPVKATLPLQLLAEQIEYAITSLERVQSEQIVDFAGTLAALKNSAVGADPTLQLLPKHLFYLQEQFLLNDLDWIICDLDVMFEYYRISKKLRFGLVREISNFFEQVEQNISKGLLMATQDANDAIILRKLRASIFTPKS